jgi:carbon-monoxide dehydrogenase iron sulfur subunit
VNQPHHLVIKVTKCRGCRSCQLACSFVKAKVFNPAKSMITLERDVETEHTAPMIHPIGCDLCEGDPACVKACRYGAITVESQGEACKILVCA